MNPKYKHFLLLPFFVLLQSNLAIASDVPDGLTLDSGIRELFLNKSKEEILKKYPDRAKIKYIPTEGETITAIDFSLYGSELTFLLDNNKVDRIDAASPVYVTKDGGRVGDSLKKVISAHRNGKFYAGIAHLEPSANYQIDGGTVVFSINTKDIPIKRFESRSVKISVKDVQDCLIDLIIVRNKI
jgi:hypothetical protein